MRRGMRTSHQTSPESSKTGSASSDSRISSNATPHSSIPSPAAGLGATPMAPREKHTHNRNDTSDTTYTNVEDDDDDVGADFIEVSDELPTREMLQKAGDVPVYDSTGNARLFKTLYTGVEHVGQRQLIIFVRHFYCAACRGYMKALLRTITPSAYFTLSKPTRITIIGCGEPSLIPKYTSLTACPFPIYAEPTRKIYKALGMNMTLGWGKKPDYLADTTRMKITTDSLGVQIKSGWPECVQGGNWAQIGGEFLFEEGRPKWCHRMHKINDHAEMVVVKKVLEMEGDDMAMLEGDMADLEITSSKKDKHGKGQTKKLKLVKERDGIRARLDRSKSDG